MRIDGWHVDGFGVIHDADIHDLDSGVTVFLGENEAGKSTLLAFLRAMLFGFPDGRSRENPFPPVLGGRHGGHIRLTDDHGTWTVSRHSDKRKVVSVIRPDGRPGDEGDLRRLLAGVDATLFTSVFAFSLDELQQFATLDAESVRDRIFSAGISGAGHSARSILKQLGEEEARLLKKQRGAAVINNLARAINDAEVNLRRAVDQASAYPELARAEAEQRELVTTLDDSLAELGAARRRYETLISLRPEWDTLAATQDLLARLPQSASPTLPATVADLMSRLHVVESREATLADSRTDLGVARAELARHQQRLGPEWTRRRVRAADDSIAARDAVREWRRRLTDTAEEIDRVERDERIARLDLLELEADRARCAEDLPKTDPLSATVLGEREAALRSLRTSLHDLQMAELQASPDDAAHRRVWRVAAGGVALALVAGLAAALAGATQLALGLAAGAVLLVLVTWAARLAATRSDSREGAPLVVRSRLLREVAETATSLGLDERPSEAELNRLEAQLSAARAERVSCDYAESQLRDMGAKIDKLRGRAQAAANAVAQAQAKADDEQAAWRSWLASRDLPVLSPEGTLELFEDVRQARTAHDVITRVEGDIAAIEAERHAWTRDALAALTEAGYDTASPTPPQLAIALASLDEVLAKRAVALDREAACEQRLRAGLSALGDGEPARRELAEGDLGLWRTELERLATESDDVNAARTVAIERRRDAQRAREDLEQSADVPRLQADLESLRAELAKAVHDYRVVTTAAGLVRETLQQYVRDRQPGVLEQASSAFATVTGGRFRAIVQEATEDSDIVVVEQWDGARLTPDQLSRGTCEQLYLAIRLALVGEFAARGQELPLIMDDCLVNFDPERAAAMARLIAASAAAGQCLFFTCHPGTADLMRRVAPDARLVNLPARSVGPVEEAPPLFAC